MLNEREQSALRTIQDIPQWKVVLRVRDELINKIVLQSVVKDSQWETIKAALERDGKVRGIKEFFQEILNQSSNENKR